MRKGIKTILTGVFLIAPLMLLILFTIHMSRREAAKKNVDISKLKIVTPVAIIDEITKKIEEEDFDDAISKINNDLPDPDIPSSNGTPLLVLAAEKNYSDIVTALVQKGADPNKPDVNTSETALLKAIRNKDFTVVYILLSAGANPNLPTTQGLTPLDLAINLRDWDIANHLLLSGATNGVTKEKLLLYSFEKNPVGVELMLAGGITPNIVDKDNNTPLIIAAANNDMASAKKLISYRANINARNKSGMTALLYAVKGKHWQMADYLINSGAKINIANIYGQNALFWAAYHGNAKLVHDLLMLGADYNKKTRRGQTALQMAKALNHKETVKMLEDFIAYKNLPRDSKGNIILPKVNPETATNDTPAPAGNPEGNPYGDDVNSIITNDISAQVQAQSNQNNIQTQAGQIANQNKPQKKLPVSTGNRTVQQQSRTQVNNLQNQQNKVDTPPMPGGGMDMAAIMSMAGSAQGMQGQGTMPGGNMNEMLKQMQNMGGAAQGGKTLQGMPANMQMPAGMNMPAGMDMGDISKMIPPGTLPEGIDINSLSSMSPDQLKKMGVPEDQISSITKAQQQVSQVQRGVKGNNKPVSKNKNYYQSKIIKTQVNKLEPSNNSTF